MSITIQYFETKNQFFTLKGTFWSNKDQADEKPDIEMRVYETGSDKAITGCFLSEVAPEMPKDLTCDLGLINAWNRMVFEMLLKLPTIHNGATWNLMVNQFLAKMLQQTFATSTRTINE